VKDWFWLVAVAPVVIGFLAMRFAGRRDSAAAHRLVAEGAALVDVRTPGEYAAGHLEGAVNIPVDQLDRRAGEIGPKDRPVVVYCASGSRSAAAKARLTTLGFARVEDLGSIRNW
jgi:phage shock protein E